MNITAIETQGRENYGEFVMEYGISYGTNNLDYMDYKEEEGNTKVIQTSRQELFFLLSIIRMRDNECMINILHSYLFNFVVY